MNGFEKIQEICPYRRENNCAKSNDGCVQESCVILEMNGYEWVSVKWDKINQKWIKTNGGNE